MTRFLPIATVLSLLFAPSAWAELGDGFGSDGESGEALAPLSADEAAFEPAESSADPALGPQTDAFSQPAGALGDEETRWNVVAKDEETGEVVVKDGETGENRTVQLNPEEAESVEVGLPVDEGLLARGAEDGAGV